jgi:hypothetical protein
VNAETKEQWKHWMHTHSPNKLKKCKQALSTCQKADGICFLEQEGCVDGEFTKQGTTMTSEVYCKTLKTAWGRPFRTKGVEFWHPV